MLSGCGGSQMPTVVTGTSDVGASLATRYRILHDFKGGEDGSFPALQAGPLRVLNGALYGTTTEGGDSNDCPYRSAGCGTVFKVMPSGTESVLNSFNGGYGVNPDGALILCNGVWSGVTQAGGTAGYGAVYAVEKSGRAHVVYSFQGRADGETPYGRLVQFKGTLYGTTSSGGRSRQGTVFAVTPSGKERVLHSFRFKDHDGNAPAAGLTELDGVLYGTTEQGGLHGAGTVFAITTSGSERVIYSFKGGRDGGGPLASLIVVAGKLYGTTAGGGGRANGGTVFEVTTGGAERILHRFQSLYTDGNEPESQLLNVNGVLYGTTPYGGRKNQGVIFSVTMSGAERILHHFGGGSDGWNPTSGLAAINNTVYGTTMRGGTNRCYLHGCGVVFALTL
jgi:uncharacterized repeat protein (TIGR03803 family)